MGAGVYVIENGLNSHCYLGSAIDLNRRRRRHFEDLRLGNHHSRYLQRAWDKYGEQAFSFRVLFCCDKRDLLLFEQRAIDTMRPVYNECQTAGNTLGQHHTAEAKEKNRIAHLGNKYASGHRLDPDMRRKMSIQLDAVRDHKASIRGGWLGAHIRWHRAGRKYNPICVECAGERVAWG